MSRNPTKTEVEAGSSAQDDSNRESPTKRAYRLPTQKENAKPRESAYDKGDTVWLVIDGKPGSFKMIVISRPEQDPITKLWEYQLKDTDGLDYDAGKWVPEKQLNSKQRM